MEQIELLFRKLGQRVSGSEELKNLENRCQKSTRELFGRSEVFRQFLRKFPPGRYSLVEIVYSPDSPWTGPDAEDWQENGYHYDDLIYAGSLLYINFGIALYLTILDERRIKFWDAHLSLPVRNIWKVNGEEIKFLKKEEQEVGKMLEFDCWYHEIEINDVTTEIKVPGFMLGATSQILPTIVKYVKVDGTRKLFVSLPKYLDIRSFFEKYRALLSKTHRDFYQTSYKKRPKTKADQLEFMREAWERKCKGRKLSKNQQAMILSEEMKHQLEPLTIIRHYLPLIGKEKRDKK
ncbi:MAG: hypothetical protein ABR911_14330 [Syntrophales bacterium]|jgi:hypothetical protein